MALLEHPRSNNEYEGGVTVIPHRMIQLQNERHEDYLGPYHASRPVVVVSDQRLTLSRSGCRNRLSWLEVALRQLQFDTDRSPHWLELS